MPRPTGYLCGVKDTTGYIIEFSYGQPLGPHAKDA
jgi:lactoylglutathione lyase